MSKKLLSVCWLLVVTALTGGALAAEITWTNDAAGDDSWCTQGNWDLAQVPGTSDTAVIGPTSPDRGPVIGIGCSVNVSMIAGPDPNIGQTQVMDVNTDGTVYTEYGWPWRDGTGTSIININGSPTITLKGEQNTAWRASDDGVSILNISGNPTITCTGRLRGADNSSAQFILNMSGGTVEIDMELMFGDNGGGEINMSGGTIIIHQNLNLGGKQGSAPITLNMTGGSIHIDGEFALPGNDVRAGVVEGYLHGGVIECAEFTHGTLQSGSEPTDEWLLDIEEGQLIIDGDVRQTINGDVAAGRITAYGGDGDVTIEYAAGRTTISAIMPDPNCPQAPNPSHGATRVDPNVILTWTPGISGTSQNVYLGTVLEDVENGVGGTFRDNTAADANQFDPGGLDFLTTYYWRIEPVGGVGTCDKVWRLKTRGLVADPNLLLWYKLDEESGSKAYDSSGWGYDGGVFGPEELWMPTGGHDGGARCFNVLNDPVTAIHVPLEALATINDGITVSVWLKDAYRPQNDNWVFDTGYGGALGPYRVQAAVVTEPERLVWWRAGNDSNDVLTWDLGPYDAETLQGWHLWTFVKDQSASRIAIYFDGKPAESNSVVDQTLTNIQGCAFTIGAGNWQNRCYLGIMDDFRVYDYGFSDKEVAELLRGGRLELAWRPDPYDDQEDVARDTVLSWQKGDYATHHDVYLGTSFNDVNSATTSAAAIYKGRQPVEDLNYDPPGYLALRTTWYWRIDEANTIDPNVWKGPVWSFTVANFLIVDNMEDYDDDASMPENPINETWIDGWINYTGSTVYLEYGAGSAVHRGLKAMWLEYDNNYGYPVENYSEVHANTATGDNNLGFGKDWTVDGVKALSLFFYGDPNNDIEPLYVALEETSGANSVSNYGDQGQELSDITVAEWHQWDMALQDFNDGGVNIKDVNKVCIGLGDRDNPVAGGTGNLYIDDIRLYLPKCVPSLAKPDYDFSNNCIVDLADIGLMATAWLRTDAYLSVAPPGNPPVGWWKLDGDAMDSSTSGYNGAAQGSYRWVSGHINGAVEFTGSGGSVQVPDDGNTPLLRPANQISVTAWVNYSEPTGYSARLVTKGVDAGANENFALQVGTSLSWFVRDVNHTTHGPGGEADLYLDEWIHTAGTYDGNTIGIYANGRLEGSAIIGAIALLQDTNSLSIGDAVDVPRALMGKVDDVRLYDYGLSAEEVAYIATQSSGGAGTAYMPLLSVAERYDTESEGQRAVNFRDYAVMMDAWLEQVLWP